MTGMMKTYKDDIKVDRKESNKQKINSYNPSTSSRELNPYWKGGGTGLPELYESAAKSRQFVRPTDDDNFYSKTHNSKEIYLKKSYEDKGNREPCERKSYNWRKEDIKDHTEEIVGNQCKQNYNVSQSSIASVKYKANDSLYLSDEKMNKLAAKIVKAEILGDTKLVNELKQKLEAAREFRRQNPTACHPKDFEDGIMLMTTTSSGNSRPLLKANSEDQDLRSKSSKRKTETHNSNQRVKYFANDDKYNLSQMVS